MIFISSFNSTRPARLTEVLLVTGSSAIFGDGMTAVLNSYGDMLPSVKFSNSQDIKHGFRLHCAGLGAPETTKTRVLQVKHGRLYSGTLQYATVQYGTR